MESELNRQVIHLEMEAQLSGRAFSLPAHSEEDTELGADRDSEHPEHSDSGPLSNTMTLEKQPADIDSPTSGHDKSKDQPNMAAELNSAPNSQKGGQQRNLEVLRSQLWDCAVTLATSHGLHESVIRLPDQGLGFLLIDVPSLELRESLDQDMLDLVSALWLSLIHI